MLVASPARLVRSQACGAATRWQRAVRTASWIGFAVAATSILGGCDPQDGASTALPAPLRAPLQQGQAPLGQRLAAADFQIVDCRLPPRIRRLGTQRVYLAPQRPVRTTDRDCGIRGGDAVVFDPSNYATALALWLPLAEEGDPKAQTYVGDIYERGLTGSPDYPSALAWYRRAADQGYASAQVSLGQLYERGLGVTQDRVKAMNLYRQASGLEGPLEIVAAAELQGPRAAAAKSDLETPEAPARIEHVAEQQQQLSAERRVLRTEREELERSRQLLLEQQSQFDTAAARRDQDEAVRLERVAQQLQDVERREANLASQEAMLAQRERETTGHKARAAESDRQTEALNAQIERLTKELQVAHAEQRTLQAEREQLERARQELREQLSAHQPAETGPDPEEIARAERLQQQLEQLKRREEALSQHEAELSQRERDISETEAELARAQNQIDTASPETFGVSIASHVDFGNYYALVVGNDQYGSGLGTLQSAQIDAQAIAGVLEHRYRYDVFLLPNANRNQILDALNVYKEILSSQDNLLIYYAGHGWLDQENDRGYWLPVDAEPYPNTTNWVSTVDVTDIVNSMKAKHVLIIADSCYAGALTEARPALVELPHLLDRLPLDYADWMRLMASSPARLAMTSGNLEPVPDGTGGRHSIFAGALLESLGTNDEILAATRLFITVAARVTDAARRLGKSQQPTYRLIKATRYEGGDFFFVPAASASP